MQLFAVTALLTQLVLVSISMACMNLLFAAGIVHFGCLICDFTSRAIIAAVVALPRILQLWVCHSTFVTASDSQLCIRLIFTS